MHPRSENGIIIMNMHVW